MLESFFVFVFCVLPTSITYQQNSTEILRGWDSYAPQVVSHTKRVNNENNTKHRDIPVVQITMPNIKSEFQYANMGKCGSAVGSLILIILPNCHVSLNVDQMRQRSSVSFDFG